MQILKNLFLKHDHNYKVANNIFCYFKNDDKIKQIAKNTFIFSRLRIIVILKLYKLPYMTCCERHTVYMYMISYTPYLGLKLYRRYFIIFNIHKLSNIQIRNFNKYQWIRTFLFYTGVCFGQNIRVTL